MPHDSRSEAVGRILRRIDATAQAVRSAFPLAADVATGTWQTSPDGRWAGGFWVGMLWLAHHHTGDRRYADLAREWMARLAGRLRIANPLNGLVFYYGAALGAILAGDAAARALALQAALALDRIHNGIAGVFPLGGDTSEITDVGAVETNVDGLPGMALLCWAASAGAQPRLRTHALAHVRRLAKVCQRGDGSLYQSASFDASSGALVRKFTPRGHAPDSAWARAQSWGLLGFVQAAREDPSLLPAARAAADFWIGRTATDPVAFWDFDDPAIPDVERDTSATAMAAAALLKLAALEDVGARSRYALHAQATLDRLVAGYLTPTEQNDPRPPGILTEGCWQRRQNIATRHELIWGDYFLLEALLQAEGGAGHI